MPIWIRRRLFILTSPLHRPVPDSFAGELPTGVALAQALIRHPYLAELRNMWQAVTARVPRLAWPHAGRIPTLAIQVGQPLER